MSVQNYVADFNLKYKKCPTLLPCCCNNDTQIKVFFNQPHRSGLWRPFILNINVIILSRFRISFWTNYWGRVQNHYKFENFSEHITLPSAETFGPTNDF